MARTGSGTGAAAFLVVLSLAALFLAALATGLTTAPSAFAQTLAHWPRQCRADIGRTCRDVAKAEDKAVLLCLQENEARLSQACRKLLQSYGHVLNEPARRR